MALTPKDLALNSDELIYAKHLEEKCDLFLMNNFVPGENCVFPVPKSPNHTPRIVKEVARKYTATGGWKKAEFGTDHYGEYFITLAPR